MDITAVVNKRFNASKEARRDFDREAKLNLAFYRGKQWVVFDNSMRKVVQWFPPKAKARPVINLIMPRVRQEYAMLTSDTPTFNVVTSNAGQRGVANAKLAYQFLDYKVRTHGVFDTTAKALLWAIICGSGFVKVYYDPMAGPQFNGIPLGDILVDTCSPLEIFPDPSADSIETAAWLIHARVRSTDYIEEKYGIKVSAEHLDESAVTAAPGLTAAGTPKEQRLPRAIVKEYWERPGKLFPQGRYAVIVGNTLLYAGNNPYAEVCPIPFASVVQVPVPGALFGESAVTHLRPINALYNAFRRDVLDNASRLSSPPLVAPMQIFQKPPEFVPGEILYYNPLVPGRIEQLQVNPYPPQLMNTLMRLLQELDDISGLSEVSRGAVPRGLRTPEQFSQVLRQDMIRISVTARNYEKMIADMLNIMLKLARNFLEVPRFITIFGADNTAEAVTFKGDDIPEDAQLFVEAGSTLAFTRDQKQNMLLGLWDRQLVTDPRLILRLGSHGTVQELTQDIDLDTAQAQRENQSMAAGREASVEPYQNHVIHIIEHNRFRKTQEYENLHLSKKTLWQTHVELHEQNLPALPPPPPAPIIVQPAQGGVQAGQRGPRIRSPFEQQRFRR